MNTAKGLQTLSCILGRDPHCRYRLPAQGWHCRGQDTVSCGLSPTSWTAAGAATGRERFSGLAGRQHPLCRGGRGASPTMSTVAGRSPCHAATAAIRRRVLHPRGCSALCWWDAVCPPPARHATADLLQSRSLQGHRRHQAPHIPRWEEEGLLPLEAGQGARQTLVLREPRSSKQELQVTGLRGYFRCC